MLDQNAVSLVQAEVKSTVHIHLEARSQQIVHTTEAAQHRSHAQQQLSSSMLQHRALRETETTDKVPISFAQLGLYFIPEDSLKQKIKAALGLRLGLFRKRVFLIIICWLN